MTLIRYICAEGYPVCDDWQGDLPAGAEIIERLPEPFEEWDGAQFAIPKASAKAKADWESTPEHIAESRLQKRIEAILIRGLDKGLLAPEAAKRGITLGEMADLVIAESAGFNEAELARQAPDVAEGAKP